MTRDTNTPQHLDHLFSNSAARSDRWRDMNAKAQAWAAAERSGKRHSGGEAVQQALAELRALESYFAYPGAHLLHALDDRLAEGDAIGVARLVLRMSGALLSGSYRYDNSEWEVADETSTDVPDRLPPGLGAGAQRRPYFETLFVNAMSPARSAAICQEIRQLRRAEDGLVYEPVLVGTFEDAVLATILNGKIEAVVIYDGVPFGSKHDTPVLRDFLTVYQHMEPSAGETQEAGLKLARFIANIRPELDVYLLTDRNVEQLAGDPAASAIRRVFYEAEEPMEVHLNILEGVRDRQSTPHFDNLKLYASRPISTFHELDTRLRRVLWLESVPGGNVGHDRRAGQHAGAHGQHQACARKVCARSRCGPRFFRDQRHVHLEQDGLPGRDQAGRHRHRRPQLP
jgi:arginine decarboxylase